MTQLSAGEKIELARQQLIETIRKGNEEWKALMEAAEAESKEGNRD